MRTRLYRQTLIWAAFLIAAAISHSQGFAQVVGSSGAGSLDDSFGEDGILTTVISNQDDIANSVALQSDGKIIVVGVTSQNLTDSNFAVVRYDVDGSLDNVFGSNNDGKVITDIDLGDIAYDVAIQPKDQKIVVVGESSGGTVATKTRIAVVRYQKNGVVDGDFGENNNGIVILDISSLNDSARAVAIQPNSSDPEGFKIIIVGTSNSSNTSGEFTLVRLNSDGLRDGSFGNQGIITTIIPNYSKNIALDIEVLSTGSFVVAGSAQQGTIQNTEFVVIKYDRNGIVAPPFGIQTISFSGVEDVANAIAAQADDQIVVVGTTKLSSLVSSFAIVRLNANGELDKGFVGNGKFTVTLSNRLDTAMGLSVQTIQGQRKIVIAGTSDAGNSDSLIAVIRMNEDGFFDQDFGTNGIVETEISNRNRFDRGFGVVIQPDNRIVVVGSTQSAINNADFAAVRYIGEEENGGNGLPTGAGSGGCFIDAGRTGFLRNLF